MEENPSQHVLKLQKLEFERKQRILGNPKYLISIDKEGLDSQMKFKREKFEQEENLEKQYNLLLLETENKLAELQKSQSQASRERTMEFKKYRPNKAVAQLKPESIGVSSCQISDDPHSLETERRKKNEISKWLNEVSLERKKLDLLHANWSSLKDSESIQNDKFLCQQQDTVNANKRIVSSNVASYNFILASTINAKKMRQRQKSLADTLNEINYLVNSSLLNECKSVAMATNGKAMQQDNFKGYDDQSKLKVVHDLKQQIHDKKQMREICKVDQLLADEQSLCDSTKHQDIIKQVQRIKYRERRDIQQHNQSIKPTSSFAVESDFFDRSFGKSSR
eukprot:NODE_170_length_16226_cov_0.451169.p6 type:complete len:337 gc:universal NODE_170_length_16226_cov_0.451169:4465-5475(+)